MPQSNLSVRNSLSEEITADEYETFARRVGIQIKPRSNIECNIIGDIFRRLTIDQERIAMLLGACWARGFVDGVGDNLLVRYAARLRIVTCVRISHCFIRPSNTSNTYYASEGNSYGGGPVD